MVEDRAGASHHRRDGRLGLLVRRVLNLDTFGVLELADLSAF